MPDLVSRMFGYLPLVGAITLPPFHGTGGNRLALGHEARHPPLADSMTPGAQLVDDPPPSVCATAVLKDIPHELARLRIPVGSGRCPDLVVVARAGHACRGKQIAQRPLRPKRADQLRLFPVAESVYRVDAPTFSQDLDRLPAQGACASRARGFDSQVHRPSLQAPPHRASH